MKANIKRREPKTDILRAIAITCIILGHSKPNSIILEIRNFNVVLMMLLLGNSFYLSSQKKNFSYLDYVKKRFQRLVVPAWMFLTFFFCFFYLVSVIAEDKYYFSFSKIITSYSLTSGIGYVWIIKVSFLVAILSPFILKLSNKVKSNFWYYLLLVAGYGVYALLLFIHDQLHGFYSALNNINHYLDGAVRTLFTEFIFYGLSYSLIAAFGVRLSRLSRREIAGACLLFLGIFLLLGYQNNHLAVQAFKYPPQLYYISYGVFVSLLLYQLLDYSVFKNLFNNQLVLFLSKTSAWVYFWHIVFVYVLSLFRKSLPVVIAETSLGRFLFIMISAVVVAFIHQRLKAGFKTYDNKGDIPVIPPISQTSHV
ncbi:acyltransferase family protein [Adhaeribacter swui]|uniref:Acyltransferase family protein n=1 Tax=Adhaeribacter swui TaxID=2086471 RepID=A0A7G7G4M0_9BACT|nr:acyltransferase [Adhaeribacter swui]QNF32104.1 acyltransferase family protein [Adhaeribacter swui]